ncbi:type VI secretion system contractile sheath large subunit [Caballeronia sp. SEWSISQ10-4 2]|uniref:type VI secretion system contractile sheath large subunit n=1 Tax=Caballeronia sp. SEWSISQ10-4 2 TaxID=2937438 RepID=UPI0026552872|nr:type VI secretion system contractile sheath large subunit [Caballeronia sp. SEWSISQ10-4 2]MDN7183246.1 type VI secretion system contractile sheath large subunit [Caballeronia sp. SEWSISQ10-4 2]
MGFIEDDNVQQKLTRVRPPRVRITYDVETGGAEPATQLPFIVGIFANLAGDAGGPDTPIPYKQREFIEIDRDNIYDIMKASGASVSLSTVALPPTKPGGNPEHDPTNLLFRTLDDFSPIAVVQQVPRLAARNALRGNVRGLQARAEIDDELAATLDQICAPDQAPLRKAIADKYPVSTDPKKPNGPSVWAALGLTPEATDKLVPPAQLTADNVVAQLMGRLATTQPPVPTTNAAPAVNQAQGASTGTAPIVADATGAAGAAVAGTAEAGTAEAGTAGTDTAGAGTAGAGTAGAGTTTPQPPAADWQDALITIGHFNEAVIAPITAQNTPPAKRAVQWIDDAVVQVDAALSANLDAIMHAPSFQTLEATWRSLASLVANTETGSMLKLKVFNTRRDELSRDLETAAEFDQSLMFKLVYEGEYGTLGGNPYSLLLTDFPISNSALDVEFLSKMTQVAAAAHAPLIAGAAPAMFALQDFSQLGKPRDLQKIFEGTHWNSFNDFRQTEDSRYATLVLPRLLLRLPYDYTVAPVGFNYIEDISSTGVRPSTDPANLNADENGTKFADIDTDSKFLWGNAAYALVQRITIAFSLYQWTAAIRGEEGGGMVDGLPLYEYRTDRGSEVLFCPTEVAITDRREKELSDLGFIALCHSKGSSKAVFFGGQTVNKPIAYQSDEANANAQLSARLPYMLAASRFAHYVKVLVRRKVGAFQNRGTLEAFLNNWISQYVLLDDNATQDVKASYPLRSARIVVTEVPGAPGSYKATMFLKPHFQLEELTASIRLVADLPKVSS